MEGVLGGASPMGVGCLLEPEGSQATVGREVAWAADLGNMAPAAQLMEVEWLLAGGALSCGCGVVVSVRVWVWV